MKKKVKKIESFRGFNLFKKTNLGKLKLKLYWRKILVDLDKFFKFNLCCYNILKVKNRLIINIHLLFFTKSLFQISYKNINYFDRA
jgi:hypothetical protein